DLRHHDRIASGYKAVFPAHGPVPIEVERRVDVQLMPALAGLLPAHLKDAGDERFLSFVAFHANETNQIGVVSAGLLVDDHVAEHTAHISSRGTPGVVDFGHSHQWISQLLFWDSGNKAAGFRHEMIRIAFHGATLMQ